MSYTLLTDDHRREMLKAVGANSIDDLLTGIPSDIRLRRPLDIPPAMSEMALTQHVQQLASRNLSAENAVCFLGGGAYDHFIPSVVDAVTSRGEFYTAYTPYQAEASQGTLQVGFEFQTMICELTGLDVANASLYDGGSAVAEAVLMAHAVTGRSGKMLIPESVHPEYRQTLATFLEPLKIPLVTLPTPNGFLDPDDAAKAIDDNTIALLVQHPNFFGGLEEMSALAGAAKTRGAMFIASFDPISVGMLKRPRSYGADIAIAEGQCLGNPLMFGGPYLGLLACRSEFVRKMPGRLVGQTTDRRGNRCWVLTLQTREQHIRRASATSNICTNQALLATRATVYLSALGPEGLRETAELCARKAHYAAEQLCKIPGVKFAFDRPFFKEFVIRVPGDARNILAGLAKEGILGGLPLARDYPQLRDGILVAVTEKRTKAEIDRFAAALRQLGATK
ncbi:MAG: aminomethyl-transferring glycine dehydrogenase subunit GcvPA [Gemmataceae bacterium]